MSTIIIDLADQDIFATLSSYSYVYAGSSNLAKDLGYPDAAEGQLENIFDKLMSIKEHLGERVKLLKRCYSKYFTEQALYVAETLDGEKFIVGVSSLSFLEVTTNDKNY